MQSVARDFETLGVPPSVFEFKSAQLETELVRYLENNGTYLPRTMLGIPNKRFWELIITEIH